MSLTSNVVGSRQPLLCAAVVLRSTEHSCNVSLTGVQITASYAPMFPRPRAERVSPGHAVALVETSGHEWIVIWRWYDAVVLSDEADVVRLWEPGHGEVLAAPRERFTAPAPGSRSYASSGLPGADWWVCGDSLGLLDLAEVKKLYDEHDLWGQVFA